MTLHDSDLPREGSNHKEKNQATFLEEGCREKIGGSCHTLWHVGRIDGLNTF